MTKREWDLIKENLGLKKLLIEAQFQVLQANHRDVEAAIKEHGEEWTPPDSDHVD